MYMVYMAYISVKLSLFIYFSLTFLISFLSIRLFVCLTVCLSACLPGCLSVCLSIFVDVSACHIIDSIFIICIFSHCSHISYFSLSLSQI